jgi:hypothetical protein
VVERTKSDERWASRALVSMLIKQKDYEAAAEVVSGSLDVFSSCSRKIGDLIAHIQEVPTAVAALELQQALDNARAEIQAHQEWQSEALDALPKQDDEEGLTGPLRQAFNQSSKARSRLLSEVMGASEKYLKAQTAAFSPDYGQ